MSKTGEPKPFKYSESKDGEDLLQELQYFAKPAALITFGLSTVDVMLYSHPKGYLQALGRYAHFAFPVFGCTGVFILTHNVMGSIRKKDDRLNWFVGGFAAGSVLGVWKKSTIMGFTCGMLCGFAALTQKHCWINGVDVFPANKPVPNGGIWSVRQDWTLTKHIPGNWTTKEPEEKDEILCPP